MDVYILGVLIIFNIGLCGEDIWIFIIRWCVLGIWFSINLNVLNCLYLESVGVVFLNKLVVWGLVIK